MYTGKSIFITFLSGITAIIISNILLMCYYNLPVHKDSPFGTTDYVWEKNAPWIKMTEGISWGRLDANGFNNPSVIENPDVLILGSSHMEAINVFQSRNTAALLGEYFAESGYHLSVYNRGISGHHFLKCLKYLKKNTESTSAKYVVIETSKIDFTAKEIAKLLENKIDVTKSVSSGIIFYLQKMPVFRLLYMQLEHGLLTLFLPKSGKTPLPKNCEIAETQREIEDSQEKLFSFIEKNASGKKIIIFYHPATKPDKNGNLVYETNETYFSEFAKAAKNHGIAFVDLTAATENLWRFQHKTTHGFCTGTAFGGHLNANGHKIVAEQLYKTILKMEQPK